MNKQYLSIQKNLAQLYTKWKDYSKNERQGYQTFLTNFFECFGITFDDPNMLPFEENTGKGFADAYIKDVVIVEMKDKNKVKTKEELVKQLPQALKYWEGKGKHVPFLVLCNFHDFIIFDTRDSSKYFLKLADLENKVESFNFLLKLNPTFVPEQEEVTRRSAKLMGTLYQSLKNRLRNQNEEVDIFVLQSLFCLFSEDIGYLPPQTFTNCVRRIRDGEDNSANILSTLFKMMDEKDSSRKIGRFQNVRYFNGPLFRIKPEIVLNEEEVDLLWQSCQLDWKNVRPEIFGALFESSQTKKARHKDGMHFTSEEDIMRVIKPCILDPWNERLASCETTADLRVAHKDLKSYRVLDPACGSGNFLVVAYRELKAIESRIFMEYKRLSGKSYSQVQEVLEWFPVTNMYGIEINQFPSFLTRVSLWITKKLVVNQYKLTEPDLPLEELKHIIPADALEVKWDDIDVVVGNPPYLGCKFIRKERGDGYFNWLGERFQNHNKMSDYCTYWFEKVLEDVRAGVRVGLVCTKTISQTNSRKASLDKVLESGGVIFDAVSNKKWSGEAKVHVSIVNFVNRGSYQGQKYLDGEPVSEISSRLKNFTSKIEVTKIPTNAEKAFVGPVPNGKGFIIDNDTRKKLIAADKSNSKVIKRFLTGEDLVHNIDQAPSRWIIDFQDFSLEDASLFKGPMKIVRDKVKPIRESIKGSTNDAKNYREKWWKFGRPQMGLRKQIEGLERFICVSRVGKYPIFCFVENKDILPADSTVAIAFDDYAHLGVLQSKFHTDWYSYQASSLKSDARYTNTTVFETFPFPEKISSDVATTMKKIETYRVNACLKSKIGLTDLYNQMKEGGHEILKKLHEDLDKAVAKSYGYPIAQLKSYEANIRFLIQRNLAEVSLAESQIEDNRNLKPRVLAKAKTVLAKARQKNTRKKA